MSFRSLSQLTPKQKKIALDVINNEKLEWSDEYIIDNHKRIGPLELDGAWIGNNGTIVGVRRIEHKETLIATEIFFNYCSKCKSVITQTQFGICNGMLETSKLRGKR